MFGDIVKVTPSSKVVGDMAIMMVTSGLTAGDVLDPGTEVAFPESVVALFRGFIGTASAQMCASPDFLEDFPKEEELNWSENIQGVAHDDRASIVLKRSGENLAR